MQFHDNRRVRTFLDNYPTMRSLLQDVPGMDDVLSGIAAAKSPGDTAKRPLSRGCLFRLLAECDVISTSSAVEVLSGEDYCAASIKRYTLAARTASQFIARELGRREGKEGAPPPCLTSANKANLISEHDNGTQWEPSGVVLAEMYCDDFNQ